MFIVIVLVSALANWLSKRNEEKKSDDTATAADPAAPPQPAESDWEARLRRMLGEEVVVPPPPRPAQATQPVPPVLRPANRPPTAPRPPVIRSTPPMRPLPVETAPAQGAATERFSRSSVEETIRRFEQLDAAVMTPVRPIGSARNHRGNALGVALRKSETARQAFVASLVFGPPKGMED